MLSPAFPPLPALIRGAVLRLAAVLLALSLVGASHAAPTPQVPDEKVLARLIWSTMVALDNANRTDNYTVFWLLGSANFQQTYKLEDVERAFSPLREQRVDVGRAIMEEPVYYLTPALDGQGRLRLRGAFEIAPNSLRFDILYIRQDGGWRIDAISVAELPVTAPK